MPGDSKVFRCYDGPYFARMLAAGIAGVLLALLSTRFERGSVARVALAGAESLCFGYVIAITVLSIRKLDELSQRIHLVAVAFSFTLTAVLVMAFGLLANAGLPLGEWYDWVWPFMAVVWGGAVEFIKRRYA